MATRRRAYIFTHFGPSDDIRQDGELIRFICWGEEVCPSTGKDHLQGYVEFTKAISRSKAQRTVGIPQSYMAARSGTQAEAIAYCEKDGKFQQHGIKAQQGKRSDIEQVRGLVREGGSMRTIIELGVNYQCIRYAEKVLTYFEKKRTTKPTVWWYWGETGTGKSRSARTEATERADGLEHVYYKPDGAWWDGYDKQAVVIIDDFRPQDFKFNYLLKLLDWNPIMVPYKGGFRQFDSELIIITCPKHPDGLVDYQNNGEDLDQLLRRIDNIKEFVTV